jgi:hypothetical protein
MKTLKGSESVRILKAASLLLLMFTLASCKSSPKFPEIYPRVPFYEFNTCVEYKLIDHVTLEIEPTGRQFPLNECDKHFCLTPEDQVKVNDWARDMNAWGKNKCK